MNLQAKFLTEISEIEAEEWDALLGDAGLPFFGWSYLRSLEETGCVSAETGWHPVHLTLWDDAQLLGIAPLYLKEHSRGEFVFDQEWARVSHAVGVSYYPKMVGMCPLTPAQGYQFFIKKDCDEISVMRAMLSAIDQYCQKLKVNSVHFLHVAPKWKSQMEALGVGHWLHHAPIWENKGFHTFDDYLQQFRSPRRKNIKRERRLVAAQGIEIEVIDGAEATPQMFEWMYEMYAITCEKFYHWSHYLNLEFFRKLGETMPEACLFICGKRAGDEKPMAMSFFLKGARQLFGRYWGSQEDCDQLHFELCYYRPIEWAIAHGIQTFDAGSGSAVQKRRRGFPAQESYSLHRYYDEKMPLIWAQNIEAVNAHEREVIHAINTGQLK